MSRALPALSAPLLTVCPEPRNLLQVLWGFWYNGGHTKRKRSCQTSYGQHKVQSDVCKRCQGYIRIGYKSLDAKQTEFNAAMSYLLKNAITGSSPDYALDYTKVLVSQGGLTQVTDGAVSWTAAQSKLTFSWTDNSGVGTALATDKAMPFVYNKDKNETIYNTEGATRTTHTMDVTVPSNWVGDKVEVYLGMVSEDGTLVADSIYLGEKTLSAA